MIYVPAVPVTFFVLLFKISSMKVLVWTLIFSLSRIYDNDNDNDINPTPTQRENVFISGIHYAFSLPPFPDRIRRIMLDRSRGWGVEGSGTTLPGKEG